MKPHRIKEYSLVAILSQLLPSTFRATLLVGSTVLLEIITTTSKEEWEALLTLSSIEVTQ